MPKESQAPQGHLILQIALLQSQHLRSPGIVALVSHGFAAPVEVGFRDVAEGSV